LTGLLLSVLVATGLPVMPDSRADYDLYASLHPDSAIVSGRVEIEFLNGSPHTVDTLWLHLYPNAYRGRESAFARDLEARGSFAFSASGSEDRGWIEIHHTTVDGRPARPVVDGTLAFLLPGEPLEPGERVSVSTGFTVKVPRFWSRMGHSGDHYLLTQWYPKMCALDERGWHRSRYHLEGEFYSDFGSYRAELDVPADFVVGATGRRSGVRTSPDSTRRTETWTAARVHDFAWAADPAFVESVHTFEYPFRTGRGGVEVRVLRTSDGEGYWEGVEEVADSTLLYYGQWYAPYPYRSLTIVDNSPGGMGGMEYPGLVVIGSMDVPMTRLLEVVVSHEIGHQWFYGMLANDEVGEAWLDEGMNTFSELRYMERRYGRRCNLTTTPGWLACASDHGLQSMSYVQQAGRETVPVLSRATDAADGSHPTAGTYYAKPALFLRMVQLSAGSRAFDRAMREYFRRFRFRHPRTGDFRRILEEATGRSWRREFDYWLRGTGTMDLSVEDLYLAGDSTAVRLGGSLPHPLAAELLLQSGADSLLDTLWLSVADTTVVLPGRWRLAEIDPFTRLPDARPWNNSHPALGRLRPLLLPMPEPSRFHSWALPVYTPSCVGGGLGLAVAAFPQPMEMGGPWTFGGYATAPLEAEGCVSFGGSLRMRAATWPRGRLAWTGSVSSRYGLESLRTGLSLDLRGETPAAPSLGVDLGAGLSAVSDTSLYGGDRTEVGDALEAELAAGLDWESYRLEGYLGGDLRLSPGWNGGPYGRVDLQAGLQTRIWRRLTTHSRAGVCRAWGDLPPHVYPAVAGALSASPQLFRRGGCGLAGYGESPERGRWALSARQSLALPPYEVLGLLSPRAYIGAAATGRRARDISAAGLRSAAGLELLTPLGTAYFPLWLSHPPKGGGELDLRWALSLDLLPGL
jgi:hypothetical protein